MPETGNLDTHSKTLIWKNHRIGRTESEANSMIANVVY